MLELMAGKLELMRGVSVVIRTYHNGEKSFQVMGDFEASLVMEELAYPGDPAVKGAKIVRGQRAVNVVGSLAALGV